MIFLAQNKGFGLGNEYMKGFCEIQSRKEGIWDWKLKNLGVLEWKIGENGRKGFDSWKMEVKKRRSRPGPARDPAARGLADRVRPGANSRVWLAMRPTTRPVVRGLGRVKVLQVQLPSRRPWHDPLGPGPARGNPFFWFLFFLFYIKQILKTKN